MKYPNEGTFHSLDGTAQEMISRTLPAPFCRSQIALSTGIDLDVFLSDGGEPGRLPLMFLHGFPEGAEHTWRHQLPVFAERGHPVAAPNQRGYGRSGKPQAIDAYRPAQIVADVLALADALNWERFVLIAHDWGGAAAWNTALARPDRIAGLVIANAPHPYVFQKTLIEDEAQRAASQYISEFRDPEMEQRIAAMGMENWFNSLFASQIRDGHIREEDRQAYLASWSAPGTLTAMLNWYRATPALIPAPGEKVELDWLDKPFPVIHTPVQVIWGMKDRFLLPVQLSGLNRYVSDLRVMPLANAGHFSPWEAPAEMADAITEFLTEISG